MIAKIGFIKILSKKSFRVGLKEGNTEQVSFRLGII